MILRMGNAHTKAVVWLAILLACCVHAFALNPSLDISQIRAHGVEDSGRVC
jgi:hypothetical protein